MDVDENDKAIMRDNDDLMMMDWLVDIGNMGHNHNGGLNALMGSWAKLATCKMHQQHNTMMRIMVLVVHQ